MRVLHVIPGVAPRYGGPSTAIWPMVRALNRISGITAEIATTDADGPGCRIDTAGLPRDVVTHLFVRDFSEQWKYSARLGSWLKSEGKQYDLFHVHALWTYATRAACAAGRRHGVPVILRPCGMLSTYTWGRTPWKKQLYWRLVEQRNFDSVTCFHVTSAAEAEEVRALQRHSARIAIIPQGVDGGAWETPVRPQVLRQRCGERAGNRPIILFLSRLHPKKGIIDYLLPALAQLKQDAFLAIAGGADEHVPSYEAEVRTAVERLGLAERVAILGAVSAEERWALFDGAALFVLPSLSENFGIVVTEAMARGVPVVVSSEVQASTHVSEAAGGIVAPLQVAAVSGALAELLADPAARAAMGERGRDYVRGHLRWDGIAARIAEMYQECLHGRAGAQLQGVTNER